MSIKKSTDTIWNRTIDLPICPPPSPHYKDSKVTYRQIMTIYCKNCTCTVGPYCRDFWKFYQVVRVITSVLYRTKNIRNAYAEFIDVLNVYGILKPVPYSMALDFTFSAVWYAVYRLLQLMCITSGVGQTTFTLQSVKWNSVQCCAVNLWVDVPNVWGNSRDFPSTSPNNVQNACVELLELHFHCLLQPLIFTSCSLEFHYVRMRCTVVLHYFLQNERKHKWKLHIMKWTLSNKHRRVCSSGM
jgi:hypothetical protein